MNINKSLKKSKTKLATILFLSFIITFSFLPVINAGIFGFNKADPSSSSVSIFGFNKADTGSSNNVNIYFVNATANSIMITYQNISNLPTCTAGTHLFFNGSLLSCTADTGSGGGGDISNSSLSSVLNNSYMRFGFNNQTKLSIDNITNFLYNYNQTSAGNFNATYNALLGQRCAGGQFVNGTLANGTIVCDTDQSGGAGGNPFNQQLNTTNNVQFAGQIISGSVAGAGVNLSIINTVTSDSNAYSSIRLGHRANSLNATEIRSFRGANWDGSVANHIAGLSFHVVNLGVQSEALRIGSDGKVVIGGTTTTQLLDVRGNGNFSNTIYVRNGTDISTGLNYLTNDSNANLTNLNVTGRLIAGQLFANATRVGVGTASPTADFVVSNGSGPTIRIDESAAAVANAQVLGIYDWYTNDGSTNATGVAGSIKLIASSDFTANQAATDMLFTTKDGSALNERMRIKATGLVGIGTNTPLATLNVNGNISATGNLTVAGRVDTIGTNGLHVNNTGVTFGSSTINDGLRVERIGGSSTTFAQFVGGTHKAIFDVTGGVMILDFQNGALASLARITSGGDSYVNNGSFGIGTTAPVRKLQIAVGATEDHYQMRIGTIANYYDIGRNFTDGLLYFTGNQVDPFNGYIFTGNSFYIKNSSNSNLLFVNGTTGLVGIGTATPISKLSITGNTTIAGIVNGQEVLHIGTNGLIDAVVNSGDNLFFNIDSDATSTVNYFAIGKDRTANSGGTELFRIGENGLVGIGTTTPTQLLDVRGNINTSNVQYWRNGSISTPSVDGSDGQLLTFNSTDGSLYFSNPSSTSGLVYFLTNSSSDVGGGNKNLTTVSNDSATLKIFNTLNVNSTRSFGNWTSPALGITSLPGGTHTVRIDLQISTTTNAPKLYFQIYQRKSNGTEVLLGQTGASNPLTLSRVTYELVAVLPEKGFDTTDRLVVKGRILNNPGSTTAYTVTSYMEGSARSIYQFPADSGTFVPYTGATQNVNLGLYNLLANKVSVNKATSTEALNINGSIMLTHLANTQATVDTKGSITSFYTETPGGLTYYTGGGYNWSTQDGSDGDSGSINGQDGGRFYYRTGEGGDAVASSNNDGGNGGDYYFELGGKGLGDPVGVDGRDGRFFVGVNPAGVALGLMGIGTTTITASNILTVAGNVSISNLIKLDANTLPTCNLATNGSIGRNNTGLYFCAHNAVYTRLA